MKRSQNKLPPAPKIRLLAIVGPTAAGKSQLALRLASLLDAEIVCVDSVTAYRGLSIGTAKPTESEQAQVRHHMLDVCDLDVQITVVDFVRAAQYCLEDIWSRGKTAILVGGSGLYMDALLYDFTFKTEATDDDNEDFHARLEELSVRELQELVNDSFPGVLNLSDFQNKRRLIRTILRGPAERGDKTKKHDGLLLGIDKADDVLKTTIMMRTEAMLGAGFIEEVRCVRDEFGQGWQALPALSSVGYRQVVEYLVADGSDEVALAQAINQATWRLVKKQRKWFQRNADIQWVDGYEEALKVLRKNRYNI